MKNIYLLFVATALFASCDNRTPQQKAQDEYNKEKTEQQSKTMVREQYMDSLVNVASGVGEFKYMRENRLNALRILKKEYPNIDFSKIEADIFN